MFVSNKYKEGVIYSTKGHIYTKIKCSLTSQDEEVYKLLAEIKKVLLDSKSCVKINYCQDKILDKKPDSEVIDDNGKDYTDENLTLEKFKYTIDNMHFTDEQIYGKKLDGKDREYSLIYKDNDNKEYPVPLEGFDSFEAKNPNGAFNYDSENKQLIFSAVAAYDVPYILRRYAKQ